MQRRQFLATTLKASSALAASVSSMAIRNGHVQAASNPTGDGRKIKYVGWQIGVTYQAPDPHGLSRDYLLRLLDEMAANRMNLLSLMMISYGVFDAVHDGYCWPVRNEKLRHYRDASARNAEPSTEYVQEVIKAAADRGIAVQLFMNCGIWNAEKIRHGYPDSLQQQTRKEAEQNLPGSWVHCFDSPGGWQAALDEVADLLGFYDSPNVTSYGLERISYVGPDWCYCKATQDLFHRQTGESLLKASPERIEAWKTENVTGYLRSYAEHVRRLRPGMGVWLHTQCAPGWGHDPKRLAAAGVDGLLPHYVQFREDETQVHRRLEYLAPNPCVLHFCVRDQAPKNYPIWIKTPEIIRETIDWALRYPGDNLAGLLFFNETATSARNKAAVYEQIKRFAW